MVICASRLMVTGLAVLLAVMTPIRPVSGQSPTDRADPSVVREEIRRDEQSPSRSGPKIGLDRPPPAPVLISSPVLVGAIRVEGVDGSRLTVPTADFAAVIERHIGRTLAPEELQRLASEIAGVARARGLGLATAWIPRQKISAGVLRILVDEGRIDQVDVRGSGAAAVQPLFARFGGGAPLRTAELERQLLLAGDIPGVRIGKARIAQRSGRTILIVPANRDRVQAYATLDNWGSSTVGPVRSRLTVDINGLAARDDQLTVAGVLTPLAPEEFGMARLAYTKPVGSAGTEFTVGGYYATTHPGGVLRRRDIDGTSAEVEAGMRHPLLRTRQASFWGGLDLRVRESSQDRNEILVRKDRITTISATAMAFRRVPDGRLRSRVSLVQGLDLFDATEERDPLASRRDASGVFTKVELWAEYQQQLLPKFGFSLQAEGQFADGPLLSSEEMGLGGRYFGRAWDYREFSGDRGVAAVLELRYDLDDVGRPFRDVQLYAYGDAGVVGNYRTGTGGGSLASVGGGVRAWLDEGFDVGLELGIPLTDGWDPDARRAPRLSFSVGKRF